MVAPERRQTLDAYLARCHELPTGTRPPRPPAELGELSVAERSALVADLIARHRAGEYRGPAYFAAEAAWGWLLESLTPMSGEPLHALLHAIGATRGYLCGYPWRFAWEQAQAVIAQHGITPELHDALRAMQASMKVHQSDKHAAVAIDRALFFERFSRLDPDANAADVVRRDLRTMPPAAAKPWEKLLAHGMSGSQAEPKATWRTKAARLASKAPDFDARAWKWLGEVAEQDVLRTTPAGADALRALLWTAAERDGASREIVAALAAKPYRRGNAWSPRHDRYVGAIAWAVGVLRPDGARPLLDALHARFGRTTAKYAIEGAVAKLTAA